MPKPVLDAQARRTLLDQLAAKRKQQQGGTSDAYRELEDSESEENGSASEGEDSFTTAASRQPVVALEDSDDDRENQEGATSRPAGGAGGSKLNRLRRAGEALLPPPRQQQQQRSMTVSLDSDDDDFGGGDDIAAQLGGLSIKGRPAGSGAGNAAPSAAAPAQRARLDLGRSQHSRPEAPKEPEPDKDANCLQLGGRGEFRLNAKASGMLYPHQLEGAKWLWSLFRLGRGGILADDMGLGKTIQCAAFLAGLIESRLIRRAIVVAPKTLLAQWRKELGVCGLQGQAHEYGGTANERDAALGRVVRRRGVLLTTYGMVLHNAELLGGHEGHDPDDGPMWDIMICDEGHKLKNPRMQLRKQLDEVPVALRVIISGTPIQNNLMEMWALFNFCAPDVLGEPADFKERYEKAITHGSDKHATQYERERGALAAGCLRQETGPYMLRREKKEVFQTAGDAPAGGAAEGEAAPAGVPTAAGEAAAAAAGAGGGGGAKPAAMPHKNDLIVWLKLQPMQRKVYQAFLNSDSVKKVFNQTASALAAITVLKKVCDHPALLSERAAHGIVSGASRARRQAAARLGGGGSGSSSDVEEIEGSSEEEGDSSEEEGDWESDSEDYSSEDERQQAQRRCQKQRQKDRKAWGKGKLKGRKSDVGAGESGKLVAPAAGLGGQGEEEWSQWASAELEQQLLDEVHTTGFAASCKTVFVMGLLKQLVPEGHRTLIFSQSRVMLNILEAAIKEKRWRYCRIDGSVASAAEREARVRQFQTSTTIPVFLLTSQVGGLGLTLTAADRVIILDPAWNPSTDNQSVDRAYRIGQRRDVVVYRLISCGTVEEKIYRRQVFKGGLSRTGMEEGEQFRYFAQQDLRDLFRLEASECESSRTQRELHGMHAHQRRETPALREHLQFLRTLDCYAGVSDHDLLFSKKEREAPPGSSTASSAASAAAAAAGLSQPAFGSAAPGGAGGSARKAGRSGSVFGKTAAQGWSGGNELSDLFVKAVTIGGGSGAAAAAAAARPPGSAGGGGGGLGASPAWQSSPSSPTDAKQDRIGEVEGLLERKRHLLTLSHGLADGGARIRIQIAELEAELAALTQPQGPAVPTAAGSTPADGALRAPPSAAALGPDGTAAVPVPAASTVCSSGLPASKPGPDSNALVAAASLPLPSSKASAAVPQPAAAPAARPAAPVVVAPAVPSLVAVAPAPAVPVASPLLARVFSNFWSGKQPAIESGGVSGQSGGSGKILSFGSRPLAAAGGQQPPGAGPTSNNSSSVIDLSEDDPPVLPYATAGAPAHARGVGNSGATAAPASTGAAAGGAAGGGGGDKSDHPKQQPSKPKAPLSSKEIKSRLMETLQAIKAAEAGGYYDREKVDKLRRRAGRLAGRLEEAKRSDGAVELP